MHEKSLAGGKKSGSLQNLNKQEKKKKERDPKFSRAGGKKKKRLLQGLPFLRKRGHRHVQEKHVIEGNARKIFAIRPVHDGVAVEVEARESSRLGYLSQEKKKSREGEGSSRDRVLA